MDDISTNGEVAFLKTAVLAGSYHHVIAFAYSTAILYKQSTILLITPQKYQMQLKSHAPYCN